MENILGLKTTIAGDGENLEDILGLDISGKYDLRRDLMHNNEEGSFDDGEVNYVFRFYAGEVGWEAPIEIIDIHTI